MKKRIIGMVLALVMVLGMSVPAMADAPSIEKVEYKRNGRVEVEFTRDVDYNKSSVSVKDSDGKSYSANITKRDDDELTFKVSNIAAGKTYSFTITNVRVERTTGYGSVSGSFTVPGTATAQGKPEIEDIDYDSRGRVEIEFRKKVQFKNVSATVKDEDGNSYSVKITKRGSDELKLRVSDIIEGKRYTVTVNGVALKGSTNYTSVSGQFTAYDD